MMTTSKPYNPNLATSSQAFDPSKPFEDWTQQKEPEQQPDQMQMIIAHLTSLGFETEWDGELNTILCKKFEDCTCCRGFINLCDGEMCANMGMCVCIYSFVKNKEFEED